MWTKLGDKKPDVPENEVYPQIPCLVVRDGYRYVEMLHYNPESNCWDDYECDDYYCDLNDNDQWMLVPDPPVVDDGN